MSRDVLPDPWRSALERRGIHSKRGLATKAGISPQTAKRLIDGEGVPSHETVKAVADAVFDGNRQMVWKLAGAVRQDHGDWNIPQDLASQLNEEQRAAVLAVVRAMIPAEARGRGETGGRNTAPIGGSRPDFAWQLTAGAGSGKTEAFILALMEHAKGNPSAALRQLSDYYLESDDLDVELFTTASAELGELVAAARSGVSAGRAQRREMDAAGEENQDTRGVDPA